MISLKPRKARPALTQASTFASLALAMLSLCYLSNGLAQESGHMLAPLVISGSRTASDSFVLPFSVNAVNSQHIQQGQLGINSSEVLMRVPGIVVQNRQNYAQDLQISSRGFGARAAFGVRGLKLISDGIPATTADGQGQVATFNLDTAERIEVLRGPAATLYGSNSGGVIQLFSKEPEGAPQVDSKILLGSDNLSKQLLSAQGRGEKAGFLVNTSRMDTDGYRDHSRARRDQSFAKLTLEPTPDSTLKLIYSSLEQNATQDPLGQTWQGYRADPRSATEGAYLYNTRKSIDHQQLGANYEQYFAEHLLQVSAYTGKRRVLQYLAIPKSAPANTFYGGGVVDFDRRFEGASVRWLHRLDTVDLVFGVDYEKNVDDRQGYQNFVGNQLGVKGALRRDEYNTALSLDPYLQATWHLNNWTLQGGLRYSTLQMDVDDNYLANGDDSGQQRFRQLNPAVSVGYAFSPNLNVYVSASSGTETPTQSELAYATDNQGGINHDLSHASSVQYELGLKARLAQKTLFNSAIFSIQTDDEIVVFANTNGRTSYQNAGRTSRKGIELQLEHALTDNWTLAMAYTYLKAQYRSAFASGTHSIASGKALPGIPRNTFFAELNWQPISGINLALEGVYRAKVYVDDSNTYQAAPAYHVFNVRGVFEHSYGELTLQHMFRLENLFDRRYVGSVIVGESNSRFYEAAPERSWYLGTGLSYRF